MQIGRPGSPEQCIQNVELTGTVWDLVPRLSAVA